MLESQKILLELSEVKERGNKLPGTFPDSDKVTPAAIDECRLKLAELEPKYRAAIASESHSEVIPLDGEEREFRSLRGKVDIRHYVAAAIESRGISGGPELEFNQALNLAGDQFPMRLLAPEIRTAVDGDAATSQQNWIGRVFAESAAARIGVDFRTVAPGITSVPVITGGATGAQRGRAEDTAVGVPAVTIIELKPKANSVYVELQREDSLRMPGFENAVVADLRGAVLDAVDKAVFLGDAGATGTDADIVGLLTAAGVIESTLTQTTKIAMVNVLALFAGLVDGQYANRMSDLRVILSVGANQLWTSTIPNALTGNNASIGQVLRDNGVSWQVKGGIDTATLNDDYGAFIGLERGIAGSGVAAVWEAGMLVRDPYSQSKGRTVSLELSYMWDLGFPRPANYKRLKFVT